MGGLLLYKEVGSLGTPNCTEGCRRFLNVASGLQLSLTWEQPLANGSACCAPWLNAVGQLTPPVTSAAVF